MSYTHATKCDKDKVALNYNYVFIAGNTALLSIIVDGGLSL